jgi:chromosome segregation ATPase
MRELHYKSLLRSKDAEIQCLTAKYEEQRRAAENEAARCRALSSQVSTFSHTESELRSQLNIYVEKFKQVEDTLNNSNELFLTFRKEMEEMSKKTKRLEKENLTLTRKHDQTNRNILEMAEERTRNHEELDKWRKKSHHLEALCRRMQAQGRGQGLAVDLDGDDEGTESEYEEDYEDEEDEEGISDEEYELESANGDHTMPQQSEKPVFGPPPPPSLLEARANGKAVLNGCH